MPTVRFKTLGCRLNISETDALAGQFAELGYTRVAEHQPADITVVNTCTVTDKADSKNRYFLRKNARDGGMVVATGCYVQTDGSDVAALDGVDLVVDNQNKGRLPAHVDRLLHARQAGQAIDAGRDSLLSVSDARLADTGPDRSYNFAFSMPAGHTRAYLKVQDGCNKKCSYCKIPQARGRAVSAPPQLVERNYRRLKEEGIGEAVLTGINLGWYRIDPAHNVKSLPALVERLLKLKGPRLRISSIEPGDITPGLADTAVKFAADGGAGSFCPYFHVPVQSGSDRILKAMRRGYTRVNFIRRMQRLRDAYHAAGLAEPFFSTDIIVGFPGESDDDFEQSLELVENLGLAWVHVFKYSPRQGTHAVELGAAVDSLTAKARVEKLRLLAEEKIAHYYRHMTGCMQTGIWQPDSAGGYFLTENYLKLRVDGRFEKGQLVRLKVGELLPRTTAAGSAAGAGLFARGQVVEL